MPSPSHAPFQVQRVNVLRSAHGALRFLEPLIFSTGTTLPVSVNGEKQDGGFDDVEGEVFPCAGSYRSGVIIRLLKVRALLDNVLFDSVGAGSRCTRVKESIKIAHQKTV